MNDEILINLKHVWALIKEPLFELSGTKISAGSVFAAIMILLVSLRLSNLTEQFIRHALKDKPVDDGLKTSIERFSRYFVLIVGALITLDTIGISLNSLAAIGAVLMVGIGFGLQNITQNFISGLIILLERPIKVGDIVKVGGNVGKVRDIKARSTHIQTRDDLSIIVPNSLFISEQIINESYSGKTIRLHVRVGVAYGSDIEKVRSILLDIASNEKLILKKPHPIVVFENFGDSSLDFDLRVWSSELWQTDNLCSDIRFEIDRRFREEKIHIPFPQRDVHLYSMTKT